MIDQERFKMVVMSARQKKQMENLRLLGLSYKEIGLLYGCSWGWCRNQIKTLPSGATFLLTERTLSKGLIEMARTYPFVTMEIMRLLVKSARKLIAKKNTDEAAARQLFRICYSVCQALQ